MRKATPEMSLSRRAFHWAFALSTMALATGAVGCAADADAMDEEADIELVDIDEDDAAVGQTFTGEGTMYNTSPSHVGACYPRALNHWSTLHVALNAPQFGGGQSMCGKKIVVTHVARSYQAPDRFTRLRQPLVVTVSDKCPECRSGDVDFHQTAWARLMPNEPNTGRHKIQWHWQ
jgi:hypothetical protein